MYALFAINCINITKLFLIHSPLVTKRKQINKQNQSRKNAIQNERNEKILNDKNNMDNIDE